MTKYKYSSLAFIAVFFLLLKTVTVNAQKLPQIQKGHVPAPSGVEINGDIAEWGGGNLEANNKVNRISYTVANDDQNIYLIVAATESPEIEKIIRGGLIFTVSQSINKKSRTTDKNNKTVRFPIPDFRPSVEISENRKIYDGLKKNKSTAQHTIDSLKNSLNTAFKNQFKEIEVGGFPSIKSGKIPIGDASGISASAQFDKSLRLTLEFKLPLNLLGLSAENKSTFSYSVKLPGPPAPENSNPNAPPPPMVVSNNGLPNFDYEYVNNPTELWGVYTLILSK